MRYTILALLVGLFQTPAPRPMKLVDLLNLPGLGDPQLAPDARQVTHHATSAENLTWAPSGDAIYFIADEPKSKEQRDRERQKDDVFAYDENFQQQHLWKVTVADGAEHRITEGDYSVLDYALSRDG